MNPLPRKLSYKLYRCIRAFILFLFEKNIWVFLAITMIFSHSNLCYGHDNKDIIIYDAIQLLNKPDLGKYGLRRLCVLYTGALWLGVSDRNKLPDKNNVLNQTDQICKNSKIICLDIEHWLLRGNIKTISRSIENLSIIIGWIKSAHPNVLIGYYGILPIRDYWRALEGGKGPGYKKWQHENDMLKPLAKIVDVVFPSLYTFYDDPRGWVRYAQAQINEAKRYGKPIIAFIWPYYHGSNKLMGGSQLPTKFWYLQLETLKRLHVGIAIWTSGSEKVNNPNEWDSGAGWWIVTKKVLLN